MHKTRDKIVLWLVVVLGGAAVIGSYAYELWAHPSLAPALWGGVAPEVRPIYAASMLVAAVSYFLFTAFVLFHPDVRPLQMGLFAALYALILVPSALWMPLTVWMVEQPSALTWLAIRLSLALTGLGSVGVFVALVAFRPRRRRLAYVLALLACLAFCLHTALLDAIVWPAHFPTGL